jgi:L-rhamnose mutarotase
MRGLVDLPGTKSELLLVKNHKSIAKFAKEHGLIFEWNALLKTMKALKIKTYGIYTRRELLYIQDKLVDIFFNNLDSVNAITLIGGKQKYDYK